MGKKHKGKKHHKKFSEASEAKYEKSSKEEKVEKPIKLVLKMGSGSKEKVITKEGKERPLKIPMDKVKDHSKKKKKKGKDKDKDKKKHKHEVSLVQSAPSPALSSHSGHEKSSKKKKRDRSEYEESQEFMDIERPIKKIHIKPLEPPQRSSPESQRLPEIVREHDPPTPLQLCLENLHRMLQRKDVNGFFAYPVNDNIAPGYSRVISHPMDFSTMKLKIDNNKYHTIESFREDYNLMCNNAMIYNAPETIYYKAARKMIQTGSKLMTEEKIKNMYRSMGYILPEDEVESGEKTSDEPIDVDTIESDDNNVCTVPKKKSSKRESKPPQVNRKVLAQVQEAALRVRNELAHRQPRSKLGFLRRGEDGATTLAVLNPDNAEVPESYPVNLGSVVGKVSSGSHATAGFKEDKKNKAIPVSYLLYGPFGSFAPTFDSSKATITKEESDLLYSTYGDETGIYYAKSIQDFIKNSSAAAHNVIDRLLNALTDGGHSKYQKKIEEIKSRTKAEEKLKEEKQDNTQEKEKKLQPPSHVGVEPTKTNEINKSHDKPNPESSVPGGTSLSGTDISPSTVQQTPVTDSSPSSPKDVAVNIDSLLSLQELGIDVSFLKTPAESTTLETADSRSLTAVEEKLTENTRLLADLEETQKTRLAVRPDGPISATPELAVKPLPEEQNLAELVSENLKNLTAKVWPEDVVSTESLRAAMGIAPCAQAGFDRDEKEVGEEKMDTENGAAKEKELDAEPMQTSESHSSTTLGSSLSSS